MRSFAVRSAAEEGQGLAVDADGSGVASPISATTVVHHQSGEDEYWTVLTGSTVVAHCVSLEQASVLADTLNDAKRVGDAFDETRRYKAAPPPSAATARTARCQGLTITPSPQPRHVLEPQVPPSG